MGGTEKEQGRGNHTPALFYDEMLWDKLRLVLPDISYQFVDHALNHLKTAAPEVRVGHADAGFA